MPPATASRECCPEFDRAARSSIAIDRRLRQPNREGASLADLRLDGNLAAMGIHDPPAEGQSDTRAGIRVGRAVLSRFGREERPEDVLEILRRDAAAGVADDQ